MNGKVFDEIEENIKEYKEMNIEQIPISLVEYWINVLKKNDEVNCRHCQYFISNSASSSCLKRDDIGYKGTCIDGMDLHKLAKSCPYFV